MRQKHYYFTGVTPWSNETRTDHAWIAWYRLGGKVRGELFFKFFETKEEAEKFGEGMEK